MGNSAVFTDEMKRFEGKESGIATFTAATLDALPKGSMGTPEKPSETAIYMKRAFAFAERLFGLRFVKSTMQASERDEARCAVLLHGAMLGNRRGGDDADAYEKAATFVRSGAPEGFVPNFVRDEIADMIGCCIETHGKDAKRGADPQTPAEKLVVVCVALTSLKEASAVLSGTMQGRKGYLDAVAIAREMTNGRFWDGCVYDEDGGHYVFLDGQKVPVPSALDQAFVTLGEAKKRKPRVKDKSVLGFEEFSKHHPGWNRMIYGSPGDFFIMDAQGRIGISDVQAAVFGVPQAVVH